jgi:hypothetical protein
MTLLHDYTENVLFGNGTRTCNIVFNIEISLDTQPILLISQYRTIAVEDKLVNYWGVFGCLSKTSSAAGRHNQILSLITL